MLRYSLRTLLILTTLVAAFFGGRASTAPRVSELEEFVKAQSRDIRLLYDKNRQLHDTIDLISKKTPPRPFVPKPQYPPVNRAGLSEAEPGVYFLAPINH